MLAGMWGTAGKAGVDPAIPVCPPTCSVTAEARKRKAL